MIIIGFLAGLLSTLVGIGGGPLFNPMLISIGLHPQAASATGMYLVQFVAGTNSLLYAINKTLLLNWSLWMLVTTATAAIIGITMINKIIAKTK